MITVGINTDEITRTLQRIEHAVGDLSPLMRSIAAELGSQTEQNFRSEGRPAWSSLSPVTIANRERNGNWPGQMLQVSAGGLAASIVQQSDSSSAVVGSNKPYAAMQHFGGKKSKFPHLWGDIPARNYLPMDSDGEIQTQAADAVLELSLDHLRNASRV